MLDVEPKLILPALERACAIKAEVVERDEREGGLRRLLNYGHTLAHAIEKHAGYKGILHGEAVSMGMVFAAERSESLGFAPAGTAERLTNLLVRAGLPTRPPDRPRRAYLSAIAVDKKKQGGKIHFVVLDGIGSASTAALEPGEILPPGWKAGLGGASVGSEVPEGAGWNRTARKDAEGEPWIRRCRHRSRARVASESPWRSATVELGVTDLARAALGEALEWPARIIHALTQIEPGEAKDACSILEEALDAWAIEAGLGPLSEAPEGEPEPEVEPRAVVSEDARVTVDPAAAGLGAPLESFELDQAFAEAEAQVEEMHDVQLRGPSACCWDEPSGLAELDAEEALAEGEPIEEAGVDPYDVSASEVDAAWVDSPPVLPDPPAREAREGIEASGREAALATLERWLGNLEKNRAGRAQ